MKKKILAFAVAMFLCLTCCADALALGDTLRWGINSSPDGKFLSGLNTSLYDSYVMQLTGDPLFWFDDLAEEEAYLPRLAESWEISEDMLTYTFHLARGVRWYDGEPFTARDVAFDLTTQCDARLNASGYVANWSKIEGAPEYHAYTEALARGEADGLTPVSGVSGVRVIDDFTISITLSEVYAPFLSGALNGFIIYPKHVWERIPVDEWSASDQLQYPIGTGAYRIERYEQDQYVTFVANEDYFLGAPKIRHFVYKIVNEDTAQVELINGELDVISMLSTPTDESMRTYTDNGIEITEFSYTGYVCMFYNTQLEKLGNAKIRQGIATAINRRGIVENLLNNHGCVMDAPIFYDSWAYPDDLNPYTYDPEAALALLAEGGVADVNGDGKLEWNGEPYALSILCPSGNKVREQAAVVIQQNLTEIGIDVTLELLEFNTVMERSYYDDDFEMALIGLTTGLDPYTVYSAFCTENQLVNGTANRSRWAMPELDELMIAGTRTTDIAERAQIYYEVAHILNENQPECWLYSPNQIRASRPELKNYALNNSCEFLDVQDWYFEE